MLAVPPAAVERAVDDALAAGARAIVAITAGAADGDAGGARDAALAARVRAAGAVLLGPNCLGVFDAAAELELAAGDLPPRRRSGSSRRAGTSRSSSGLLAAERRPRVLALRLARQPGRPRGGRPRPRARRARGHRADRRLRRGLPRRPRVRAAAAARPRGQARACCSPIGQHARRRARAVRSHTGALASDARRHRRGLPRRRDRARRAPQELVDLAAGAAARRPPARAARRGARRRRRPRRDRRRPRATRPGSSCPRSPRDGRALRAPAAATAAAANPVDLAGGGEQDIRTFDHAARALLESGEVDALLLTGYFGGYSEYGEAMARAEARSPRRSAGRRARRAPAHRPLDVRDAPPARGAAAAGVAGVPLDRARRRTLARSPPRRAAPRRRPAAAGAGAAAHGRRLRGGPRAARGGRRPVRRSAATVTARDEARRRGRADRLPGRPQGARPPAQVRRGRRRRSACATRTRSRAAVADLVARLAPGALGRGMAPVGDGVELLVGARRDARFGPSRRRPRRRSTPRR